MWAAGDLSRLPWVEVGMGFLKEGSLPGLDDNGDPLGKGLVGLVARQV